MKKHLRFACWSVVLAACFTPPVLPAEKTPEKTEVVSVAENTSAADLIPFASRPFVERGMARDTALRMLGEPGARLSRDAWVYFNFPAANPRFRYATPTPSAVEKLDTLVIEFARDRVSRIRWCDGAPVREFLARRESQQPVARGLAAR